MSTAEPTTTTAIPIGAAALEVLEFCAEHGIVDELVWAEELEPLIEDWDRVAAQAAAMIDLRPAHAESYLQQRSAAHRHISRQLVGELGEAGVRRLYQRVTDLGAMDTDTIRCWCGAVGAAAKLFDVSGLDESCGGSGVLYCHCGGDLCVCHHHGEIECDGCEDCEDCEDDDGDDER